ncbi:hypothetical protein F4680DRAFT_221949 [Xylaria scruposa]|nr:hypothetical protein F4680DRAFT_221949 [Xylaria scruposa]
MANSLSLVLWHPLTDLLCTALTLTQKNHPFLLMVLYCNTGELDQRSMTCGTIVTRRNIHRTPSTRHRCSDVFAFRILVDDVDDNHREFNPVKANSRHHDMPLVAIRRYSS